MVSSLYIPVYLHMCSMLSTVGTACCQADQRFKAGRDSTMHLHSLLLTLQHACPGQTPKVYKTKSGRPFMRTGAGSAVGVSEDEEGRVFFFDRAGNLYYDTGDKRLGFYIVSI